MNDIFKNVAEKITAFLSKTVRGNQSMESWLFKDFPHGLQQIADYHDKRAEPEKALCDEMSDNCHMTGMSFSHPQFDGQYSVVQQVAKNKHYGKPIEVFDALRISKESYEEVVAQRVFFEQEFLPRLKELQQGAALNAGDYELFYLAREKGKALAPRYNQHVTGEFKPGNGTYASYMNFLGHMLETIPRPPDWQKRMTELDKPGGAIMPFRNS